MRLQFITTGIRCIGAVAVALGQCVRAQAADLMKSDPRLVAAYHLAEFAGGYNDITVDLPAHKVTFKTKGGVQKQWNCEGPFLLKEGSQQSRCHLRQTNTAIALDYQCTVVTKDGSMAVSLQSIEDGLKYGNGIAGASLLPKWLPEIPPGATLESVRVLYSGGYETTDIVLKMQVSCIRHYANSLGGHIKDTGNELHWSDSKSGSMVIVSAVTDGNLCKLAGQKLPTNRQTH